MSDEPITSDFDAIESGRELDAMVAERIMGFEINVAFPTLYDTKMNTIHRYAEIPHYSTDISAAWEVVENLQFTGIALIIKPYTTIPGQGFRVGIFKDCFGIDEIDYSTGDKAPLAICRAALKATKENKS